MVLWHTYARFYCGGPRQRPIDFVAHLWMREGGVELAQTLRGHDDRMKAVARRTALAEGRRSWRPQPENWDRSGRRGRGSFRNPAPVIKTNFLAQNAVVAVCASGASDLRPSRRSRCGPSRNVRFWEAALQQATDADRKQWAESDRLDAKGRKQPLSEAYGCRGSGRSLAGTRLWANLLWLKYSVRAAGNFGQGTKG